jgi:uncharacterized membrane protein
MNCWKCQTPLPEGAAYCSQCGVAQPVRPPRPAAPDERAASPDYVSPAPAAPPEPADGFGGSPGAGASNAPFMALGTAPYTAHPPLPPSSDPNAVEWIREGWRSFKQKPAAVPGFYVVYIAVALAISAVLVAFRMISGGSLHDISAADTFRELPVRLLLQILILPLTFGPTLYCLSQQRGESPPASRFLAGYARPWQIVINQFLIGFLSVVLLIPGFVPLALGVPLAALTHAGDLGVLAGAAIPAVLFFGFWAVMVTWLVLLPLYFSPILIVDQGRGPMASIGASWALTRGSRMQLILFSVLAVVVMLVGVLCLFVGVFVSLAVLHGALASAYRDMLRRQGTPDQEVNY